MAEDVSSILTIQRAIASTHLKTMPNFRIHWVNVEDSGCFCYEAETLKDALTESIRQGICSLDWTEAWKDCGEYWEIRDLLDNTTKIVQKPKAV